MYFLEATSSSTDACDSFSYGLGGILPSVISLTLQLNYSINSMYMYYWGHKFLVREEEKTSEFLYKANCRFVYRETGELNLLLNDTIIFLYYAVKWDIKLKIITTYTFCLQFLTNFLWEGKLWTKFIYSRKNPVTPLFPIFLRNVRNIVNYSLY